jgi:hypothetical protein
LKIKAAKLPILEGRIRKELILIHEVLNFLLPLPPRLITFEFKLIELWQ